MVEEAKKVAEEEASRARSKLLAAQKKVGALKGLVAIEHKAIGVLH